MSVTTGKNKNTMITLKSGWDGSGELAFSEWGNSQAVTISKDDLAVLTGKLQNLLNK